MKEEIFNKYVTKVAEMFDVEEESIFEKSKKRELVDARHILYYICHKRPIKVVYIVKYMSNRGYDIASAPVTYGINSVKKRALKDKDYKVIIKKLKDV